MAAAAAFRAVALLPVCALVNEYLGGVSFDPSSEEAFLVLRGMPDLEERVVYRHPEKPRQLCFHARLVGGPGHVFIDFEEETGTQAVQQLLTGQCFVVAAAEGGGDSRDSYESSSDEDRKARKKQEPDSRDFGPLPVALVRGSPIAVVWPPSRARWLQ
jgi:hypothetical protein